MSPEALTFPISHFLKDLSHSAVWGGGCKRESGDRTFVRDDMIMKGKRKRYCQL